MTRSADPNDHYIRHPRDLPLLFRAIPRELAGRPEPDDGAYLGGIRFESQRSVRTGTVLEITIGVAGERQTFRGRVHWVRPLGRRFEVAVRFASRDDAFRARMAEQACYIESFRRRLSRRLGRGVGIEQAARTWIARHARAFSPLLGDDSA